MTFKLVCFKCVYEYSTDGDEMIIGTLKAGFT